ncbi:MULTISPECIES: aKG-HExxH-type peptide beta-hydroxylase [unclassified Streptomyces]|uniref:aKG-HExxH-type peptide beta-hydroxylase n=1 Tax=unclassified Streptomyces TaxID=2593676 RepID=UPI002E100EAD|nr:MULTISPECIES: HEXXH motif-containing putative peptide modification protein [unclassified Streptomyces]WSR29139.1 HEXXH motif-containing putative peptide modification protein [Streptomyces sp. NBC_01205]
MVRRLYGGLPPCASGGASLTLHEQKEGFVVGIGSPRTAEDVLARDSLFGDSTAIATRNLARYRVGLSLLGVRSARHSDALHALSAEPAEGLLPLLGDPVLRNAFEDDVARLENGVFTESSLGDILAAWPAPATDGIGPCESMMKVPARPWPNVSASWVWTGLESSQSGQPVARRVRVLCRNSFEGSDRDEPLEATPEMVHALQEGANLLTALLPELGVSVLQHVSLIGFSDGESPDGPLQSLSGGDPLPSALLMSPSRLSDPWKTAETLLHEAAHLKLFDVLRSCSLVQDGSARVAIPWRMTSWTFIRVLVALHFYAHLTVFQAAARGASAEVIARYGPPPTAEEIDEPTPGSQAAAAGTHRTGFERLVYLAEQALCADHGQLTKEGRRFVHWLLDSIEWGEQSVRSPVPAVTGARSAEVATTASDRAVVTGGVFVRSEPTILWELPELRQLLVVRPDTAGFHWLDAHAWVVYALCDGVPLATLAERYRLAVDGPLSEETALRQARACLSLLIGAGLVSQVDE